MTTKITSRFTIDYAHRLMLHKGLCKNIHGHTATIEVDFAGEVNKKTGMIIDFGEFKIRIKEEVLSQYDHAIILNYKDKKLLEFCKSSFFKFISLGTEPTAENLSKVLYDAIGFYLNKWKDQSHEVVSVRFYETLNNWAEYRGEEK